MSITISVGDKPSRTYRLSLLTVYVGGTYLFLTAVLLPLATLGGFIEAGQGMSLTSITAALARPETSIERTGPVATATKLPTLQATVAVRPSTPSPLTHSEAGPIQFERVDASVTSSGIRIDFDLANNTSTTVSGQVVAVATYVLPDRRMYVLTSHPGIDPTDPRSALLAGIGEPYSARSRSRKVLALPVPEKGGELKSLVIYGRKDDVVHSHTLEF